MPPYHYNWSNGASTPTIFNVPAGQYCVTVTDDNACGVPVCITVTPNAPTVSVSTNNVTCYGGNNGSLVATPIGGIPPYTFQWSNGVVGATNAGLTAGTYTVTLTDGNGCTAVASGTVSQPPAINITLNRFNPTCYGDTNGSITSSVTGGTPPYTLSWNTGATTPNISGLAAGTYTLTVVDVRGCVQTASITLTNVSNLTLGGIGTPRNLHLA
ncbi:MAG: SprB repeat-containing protein [Saprospiraceae bacterium]